MSPGDPLSQHFRLVPAQTRALNKLGLKTVRDLLYHAPVRYERAGDQSAIQGLTEGADAVLFGTLRKPTTRKTWKTKVPIAEAWLEDGTGKIKLMWFHQPYIAKAFPEGTQVKVSGKAVGTPPYLANPEIERIDEIPERGEGTIFSTEPTEKDDTLFAVYPESLGITSRWFRHALERVLRAHAHEALEDPIPTAVLERYHLPALATALVFLHTPKRERDAEAARKRFAFEEVFVIQTAKQIERATLAQNATVVIPDAATRASAFIKRLPFTLTQGQTRAIDAILDDMASPPAMSRLLEGDVGSGKTAVAATTAYAVVTSAPKDRPSATLQVAYMAPTEILATQHFDAFVGLFKHLPIQLALITGSGCKKFPSKVHPDRATDISRAQLLKWVANGEISMVVGTHALIQKSVRFRDLAYVIVDEQHRFGVNQRKALVRGSNADLTRIERGDDAVTMRNERGSDADQTRIFADLTRIHADTSSEHASSELLYKDLTYRIRGALYTVKNTLGPGHKEIVYQKALAEEFNKLGIAFEREVQIPILYRNKQVGVYVPDFVVEGKVVIELKALYFVGATEKKQLWSYLKGSTYTLGLLVNFGTTDLTITRVVYDTARSPSSSVPCSSSFIPRQSASDPRVSASIPRVSASDPRVSASIPHLLSMTATPIPRTLALTLYGDLDLTLLDEMPAGRKQIVTQLVQPGARTAMYAALRRELDQGRQAYVICPRIDEPDPKKEQAVMTKSVIAEAEHLKRGELKNYRLAVLHGQMKPKEKEEVMRAFLAHETDVLVATSVVEVGVNVPNATVIVIEGAERFGLAQLHQLRGRVVRSTHQAYCYVLTSEGHVPKRLKALATAKNGFELAELDLKLRGAGELYGRQQSGLSDIGMEALKNLKLVEAARDEARALVVEDPALTKHVNLRAVARERSEKLHFE